MKDQSTQSKKARFSLPGIMLLWALLLLGLLGYELNLERVELRDRIISYGVIMAAGFLLIGIAARQLSAGTRRMTETAGALRRSEESLNRAQHLAQLGSWEFDPLSRKLTVSDETCRIFGLEHAPADRSPETLLQAIHPEDREAVVLSFTEALRLHLPYASEYRLLLPEGRVRHVIARCEWVFGSDGKPALAVGTVQEITGRKKSEEELRKLSRTVEQSPVSVVITNTSGIIEYVNPKFTELTGYRAEEVTGATPRIFQSGKTPAEVYAELWETIRSGREWHGELCNRKKNGDIYWESATIAPVTDEKGTITHYAAIKQDITEIREAREALERANQRLELQATTDFLTGIFNRHKLDEMLVKELSRSRRYNIPLSLVMFDIDHFKQVNDTFGHHTGDVILKELAAHISGTVRKHDYFARWGGEEFIILLTHTMAGPAVHFAEQCRSQIEQMNIGGLEGLTCSFGVTDLREGDSLFSFTKRVDEALYKAKAGGRNRVEQL